MDSPKFKLTDNEKAANGPLPGDLSLYEKEFSACKGISTPGYYQALNAAEIADAQRSGLFPQATFTGSYEGKNQVYAWRSEDLYDTCSFIINRKPGEIYITGGVIPDTEGPIAPGPFIAKADGTTGRQIWRTYLENGNIDTDKKWIATTNLNIHENGLIVTSWTNKVALIDPETGLILKVNTLPSGTTPSEDVSFKHLTIAPDGTIILKNQSRPTGNKMQSSLAIFKGLRKGFKQGNSVIVAVHPETLEILDWIQMPEPATTPHVITKYDNKIAIYVSADVNAYRYFWDPKAKKLSQDKSWIVNYLADGQTTGDAPGVMGDWIVIQTNGVGASVPSSIVAINQKDKNKMVTNVPFGKLKKLQKSMAPPKSGTDIENNMVYSADAGVGKVAGIHLDQKTGELTTKFIVDCTTLAFQPLVGPKDKRVLILSNMKSELPVTQLALEMVTGKYKEQVVWLNSLTGEKLAESDFFEPLTPGSLIVPGYGGRYYFPTKYGFITMQVKPDTNGKKKK